MRNLFYMLGLAIAMISTFTACNSDTVEGDTEYFTSKQLTAILDDGTKLYLLKNADGTLSVSYDAASPAHLNSSNAAKLETYVGEVNIPAEVTIDGIKYNITAVGERAFINCQTLVSVSLPESILKIGEGAFTNCRKLAKINLPAGVTEIPDAAFGYCSALKTITFASPITKVGDKAFANSKVTSFDFGDQLLEIGNNAFTRNTSMRTLTLPASLNKIGVDAFKGAKLKDLHIAATTPPVVEDSLGDGIANTVLYVPVGSKLAYENDEAWNGFKSIEEE